MCVGVVINWVIFQPFHALLTYTWWMWVCRLQFFNVMHVQALGIIMEQYASLFWFLFTCLNVVVVSCIHFLEVSLCTLYLSEFLQTHAEYQSCLSHMCPPVLVCVHKAKCWLRIKGPFPSVLAESVWCRITTRRIWPTSPIPIPILPSFIPLSAAAH